MQPTRLPLQKGGLSTERREGVAAATVPPNAFRAMTYGRGAAVGRGLGGGLDLGVGLGRGVAVGVALGVAVAVGVAVGVGVGVGVGVALPEGAWIATVIGEPVLKKPTVALALCGGWSASNRKLYSVPQRIALAF